MTAESFGYTKAHGTMNSKRTKFRVNNFYLNKAAKI